MKSIKTALYCRFANSPQEVDTVNIQMKKMHDFALQQGHIPCAEYIDSGFVGTTLDRPAFMQMDSDIKTGKIDTVIVNSIDRIARNPMLIMEWHTALKRYDTNIIALDGSHKALDFMKKVRL